MKAASIKELRRALNGLSEKELVDICLQLSKFKKDTKEFLTYLLFEANDEAAYIESVKSQVSTGFEEINSNSYYFIKKSIRKILRVLKKQIRFSKKKETEMELLIHFCLELQAFRPSIKRNRMLMNIYEQQASQIRKILPKIHEDLQFDFEEEIESVIAFNA